MKFFIDEKDLEHLVDEIAVAKLVKHGIEEGTLELTRYEWPRAWPRADP